jgi:hypothetical protein
MCSPQFEYQKVSAFVSLLLRQSAPTMPRSMTAALAEKRLVMKTIAARRFVVEIHMAVVVWLIDCKGMDRSS